MQLDLKPKYAVRLDAADNKHIYYTDVIGKEGPYNSVTYFTEVFPAPWLVNWTKKITLEAVRHELKENPAVGEDVEKVIERIAGRAEKIRDEAADYGTRLHHYADLWVAGQRGFDVDKDLENSWLAFKDWLASSQLEILMGDTKVCSLRHGYGGSFDALARDKRGLCGIIDFKTSNVFSDSHYCQVAAYGEATEEMYDVHIDWGLIVKFNKISPDFDFKYVRKMPRFFRRFMRAKELKDDISEKISLE